MLFAKLFIRQSIKPIAKLFNPLFIGPIIVELIDKLFIRPIVAIFMPVK